MLSHYLRHIVARIPVITMPIALIIGIIGYNLENIFSDKYTPTIDSVKEQREERLLKEEEKEVESLKDKKFVPKTIFEKNLSPSLQKPDTRRKQYPAQMRQDLVKNGDIVNLMYEAKTCESL